MRGSAQAPPPVNTASPHGAVLTTYCITCHNDRARTGDLSLEHADLANVPGSAALWEKVIRKVRAGMMPPAGMPRPDAAALDGFVSYLEVVDTNREVLQSERAFVQVAALRMNDTVRLIKALGGGWQTGATRNSL